ncbi:hypothetical protein Q7I15_10675 [Aeromonas veronii]|uniref:DUF6864 domain-containing function n=1 Tax=Aeromonas veronii TaxID=654 RepID=UPI003007C0B4
MRIKVGELDVIESGTVHSNGLEKIDFVLAETMTLRVVIEIAKDETPSVVLEPSGSILTMKFINPQSQLHFGPQNPVHIGTYNGRKLYCMIRINMFGDVSSYSADYTFYLGGLI